jgi:predicted lipid-binding transport protein (Tim44 family)
MLLFFVFWVLLVCVLAYKKGLFKLAWSGLSIKNKENSANNFSFEVSEPRSEPVKIEVNEDDLGDLPPELQEKIKQIKALFPVFNVKRFINTAMNLFETMFNNLGNDKINEVESFIMPELFKKISTVSLGAKDKNLTIQNIVVRFKTAKIDFVEITPKGAIVKMNINYEYISYATKNESEDIVYGSKADLFNSNNILNFVIQQENKQLKCYLSDIC